MKSEEAGKPRKCEGDDCSNDAGALQCPTCQKQGMDSYFCSQDCFKRNWTTHKSKHKKQSNILRSFIPPRVISEPHPETGHYNPFPTYSYSGPLRPVYPLSEKRAVPKSIPLPEYAATGIPTSEQKFTSRNKIMVLDKQQQQGMRKVCRLSREVLDEAARAVRPGVTTDQLDEIVHNACIARNAYPSPLNYYNFPKSVCTSVNEIICHGIPDNYVLQDGDIVNLDVSLFHDGFHGDLNETYYVGEKARNDPDAVRLVETSREALDKAIEACKPGTPYREYGNIIDKHVKSRGCSTVKTYVGHGVNTMFHCAPNVPHYAKNKAIGQAAPGVCFTIEPMVCLGSHKDKTWPDNWTSTTIDGLKSAQFEHTLLVTEEGVEVLTARLPDSPGGPEPMPATNGHAGEPAVSANLASA